MTSGDEPGPPAPPLLPAHLERGLRGVISAILIFEAIALLLALTVVNHGGRDAPAWQLIVITALAFAHLLTPAVIKRRQVFLVIFALQALVIGCWAIDATIGATGVVFTFVWVAVLWMRGKLRARIDGGANAGTISGQ